MTCSFHTFYRDPRSLYFLDCRELGNEIVTRGHFPFKLGAKGQKRWVFLLFKEKPHNGCSCVYPSCGIDGIQRKPKELRVPREERNLRKV